MKACFSRFACATIALTFSIPAAHAQLKNFKLGISAPAITVFPAHLGDAGGFFEKQGLKVEVVTMEGGTRGIQVLLSGEIQAMHVGLAPMAPANASGADLKLVASTSNVLPFVIFSKTKSDPPIPKGAKYGISTFGSETDVAISILLPKLGMKREDIEITQVGGTAQRLAALIAIFGTTISPYLFFWQASEEAEEEELELDHGGAPVDGDHVAAMRGDVIAGMGSAVVVMFSIMVAAAATLHAEGLTTIGTAEEAARALRPIAGNLASLLFTLGIVGTGSLAIPVLAGSTAYALAEAFGWHEGLGRTFREARGFYLVIVAAGVLGLAIALAGLDPIRGLYWAAILNGVAAPPLILLMFLLARDPGTVGTWRSGRLSTALVGLAFVVMAGAPLAYLLRR